MILVCDSTLTARALELREHMLSIGAPCAVCAISDIKSYLPVKIIVTFTDVFNSVRMTPYDDIYVVSIGPGFVNTALNAKRTDSVDAAVQEIRNYLLKYYKITDDAITPFGVTLNPSVFISPSFFSIFGNIVTPTQSEFLIFKYLFTCSLKNMCASVEKIQKFCYPASKAEKPFDTNIISVHISNLNKKICESYGKKIIKSVRFIGYYMGEIR